jgi:hypothetical protein
MSTWLEAELQRLKYETKKRKLLKKAMIIRPLSLDDARNKVVNWLRNSTKCCHVIACCDIPNPT